MDMKWGGSKNNRGVALLLTLTIITILVTFGLQLNRQTKASVESATALKDRYTMNQMATGAIHLGMALLIKDAMETQVDSVQEEWADPEKIAEMLKEVPIDDGKIDIVITDEMSRIQINALVDFPEGMQFNQTQREFWLRFSEGLLKLYKETEDVGEMEETDPATIINSIKDWLDSKDDDAVTELSGAESDYYMGLDPPYKCKNGPFSHVGEVALVKGIPPELFNGMGELLGLSNYLTVYGAVSGNAPPPSQGGDGFAEPPNSFEQPPQEQGGFGESQSADFTYDGRININTAEIPILMALLPPEAAEFAKLIYEFRTQKKEDGTYANDLSDPGWYKNVPGLAAAEIDPALITVNSNFFRITATATYHKAKSTLSAVVQRQKNGKSGKLECKILNWQTE